MLIIGASNYPLFLPGVQALQALAAGNAVLIKPGMGATQAAEALAETFVAAGLDENLLHVLPEEPEWVESAVEAGANKVVLTGSAQTGRSVQSLLAKSLTPATMELSGCDAVFILDSSDLGRVAKCLAFGLRFNGSATCIAPRRVFVPVTMITELERRLCDQWSSADNKPSTQFTDRTIRLVGDAISRGARVVMGGFVGDNGSVTLAAPTVLSDTRIGMELLRSDVFAPVMSIVPVASIGDALRTDRECPYALGASVFGEEKSATKVAGLIEAGCIVINDLIAPTADPRVPFGGRRESGFGVTRGAAGLEEMTQMKAIVHQRGTWLPHLDEPTPLDAKILSSYLGMSHGPTWSWRLRSAGSCSGPRSRSETSSRKHETIGGARMATKRRVAVVGGGLGGLAAAITLAARGHEVTLLERNSWLGGKAAVLNREGFRFDMGPTILTLPSVLHRIFHEAGKSLDEYVDTRQTRSTMALHV